MSECDPRVLAFLLTSIFENSLALKHRADLEKSSITEASRRAQGIRSVPPSDFQRLLGFPVSSAILSLMLLPYPDPAGGYLTMFQTKCFYGDTTKDEVISTTTKKKAEPPKYLQPKGMSPRLYFVRSALAKVMDLTAPLYLVEGQKKAIAAAQLGFAAVGFAGIQGWHVRGSYRLVDDFAHIPLVDRRVMICPDGDVQSNSDVEKGAADFAEALEAAGANVQIKLLQGAA